MGEDQVVDLHGTTDAMVWTGEFLRLYPEGSGDADLMLAWFANAIETGRMAGERGIGDGDGDGAVRSPVPDGSVRDLPPVREGGGALGDAPGASGAEGLPMVITALRAALRDALDQAVSVMSQLAQKQRARIAELEGALRGFAWDDSPDDLGCYCSGSGASADEHDEACIEVRALLAARPTEAQPDYVEYRTTACHAGSDGDCSWTDCPQTRDGEPRRSRRHCPLDALAARPTDEAGG